MDRSLCAVLCRNTALTSCKLYLEKLPTLCCITHTSDAVVHEMQPKFALITARSTLFLLLRLDKLLKIDIMT